MMEINAINAIDAKSYAFYLTGEVRIYAGGKVHFAELLGNLSIIAIFTPPTTEEVDEVEQVEEQSTSDGTGRTVKKRSLAQKMMLRGMRNKFSAIESARESAASGVDPCGGTVAGTEPATSLRPNNAPASRSSAQESEKKGVRLFLPSLACTALSSLNLL